MTGRQHEPVPVGPFRVRGIVNQKTLPQAVGRWSHSHRRAWVARLSFLDGINGQRAQRSDAKLVKKVGIGQVFSPHEFVTDVLLARHGIHITIPQDSATRNSFVEHLKARYATILKSFQRLRSVAGSPGHDRQRLRAERPRVQIQHLRHQSA